MSIQSGSELTYDDFEVEIGHGRGREYPVAVLHSEAGEACETMQFPYDELVLENRLLALKNALLGSGGKRRTILSQEEQTVQDFGSDLFNALITGEVRNRYDVSLEKAKLKGRGLRVKLRIRPPNLAVLPWEFLYEPRQAEYLGLMRSVSIVRYPEHPQPIQPLTVTLPLRILGLIASPIDLPMLDISIEKQRVEEAIKNLQENGYVELTWLEGQTWRDLQKAMLSGPWHVFHFIGHGGFDRITDEGVIALADEEGRMRPFSATELSRLLADHHSLRLVILNSCEGARGSERDLNSSTASILIRRGIPAVLAMQYKITDRAAIEFSRTFYDTLVYGLPVDAAVAEARKAISIEVANTVEWGTPVLYMRSPDGVLFNVQKKKTKRKRQRELSALYSKGTEALEAQDWQTAIEQFKKILAIDDIYKDASNKLKQAEQQLDIAKERERALKEKEELEVREKQLEREEKERLLKEEEEKKEIERKAQEEAERQKVKQEGDRPDKQREEQERIAGEKKEVETGEGKEKPKYKKLLIVIGILGMLLVGYLIYTTPTTGSISVSSSPSNASIYLDGIYRGTTPMIITSVRADSHNITLKLAGYHNLSQTFRVVVGDMANVSLNLTPKDFNNTIGMEFVLIPQGEFYMGSPSTDVARSDNEESIHHVTISKAFYMGKYEVTQKQWRDVMGTSPSFNNGDDLPVETVSWNDVQEFIKKLNEKEGTDKYRLPSEAEWEYAERAGTTTRYSFGDDESKLVDYAWYDGNSNRKTHPVGQKNPNSWRLYDMHGNVWEWVQDIWHSNYNGAPTDGSAWESGDGSGRVNRGGSWNAIAGDSRSANRDRNDPVARYNSLGFRLVRDL